MQSDKERMTRLLKTAKGQLEGLLKMVEEDRYRIDISNQLMATQAILKKVNAEILHDHIHHCVHGAFGTEEQEEKISEIMLIMDKLTK